jgi:putative FmdB family regulatory protein
MSPIYQYKCNGCGWTIDVNKSIAERNEGPMCGDCLVQMVRSISQVSAIFKGTGWGKD